jgi:tripartite ATP-independent transporter DctM subunit
MTTELIGLVMLGILVLMVICGVHLGFAMMFLAVVFGLIYRGPAVFSLFMQNTYGVMDNEILIAVPLFVLMGAILETSGAAERLFNTMYQLLGPARGGLAFTTIIISTIFAACTGVIAASVTMMALIALPAMVKRGYNHGLATGVVCAGGTLGILIPPSVMLVMMGPMCNLSVANLLAGAVFPGLLLSVLYVLYVGIRCWVQPTAGPAISIAERKEAKGTLLVSALLYMLPMIFLLVAVMGSILAGVTSPTEASALGAVGAMLVALLYRTLNLSTLRRAVHETLFVTAMVFFVIVGASMFTSMFLYTRGGSIIEQFVLELPVSRWVILALMMFIIFILGLLIDWIGILFITIPIFLPIATKLGFNPLWFVELIAVNLQMSFLTPPFAYAIFFVKGVAPPEVTTQDIYWGVVPFVALQAVGLTLCIIFPDIILWLPGLTGK